jgi:segregation and condensation protein B
MNSLGHQLRSSALRYRPRGARLVATPAAKMPGILIRRPVPTPALVSSRQAAISPTMARQTRLEAVLFLAREPLTLRKLAQLANLTDGTEARTLLNGLRQRFNERGSAFQVAQVAGGYQLLSRPEFAPWLRPRAARREADLRLSPPSLETLAVVAYRQPILRAEVEAIRGVACGEILRQLMDFDLLRIVGRSEELGRPLWYGTTKHFLQVFGLCNLEQLPLADQLRRRSGEDELGVESTQVLPDLDAGLTGEAGAA